MKDDANISPILKGETDKTIYGGYTCIGGREEDQDCLLYDAANGRQVFAVCDGMGGHAGGCIASTTAAKALVDSLRRQKDIIPITEAIMSAVTEANDAVYRRSQEEPRLRGMGTTITLLVFDANAAYVTHVGDSRIYQLRKGRKIFRTFDHSMVFEQVAKKKMTEEEARVHPRSNMLSRALGILPDIEIAVKKLDYRKDDRFILCCDGVWNTQPEKNIITMLTKYKDVNKTIMETRNVVEHIGQSSGNQYDNHTMIVVDMKTDSKYRRSIFTKIKNLFRK